MSKDSSPGLFTGIAVGAGLVLLGGYLFGGMVLKKVMGDRPKPNKYSSTHLERAQQALKDSVDDLQQQQPPTVDPTN